MIDDNFYTRLNQATTEVLPQGKDSSHMPPCSTPIDLSDDDPLPPPASTLRHHLSTIGANPSPPPDTVTSPPPDTMSHPEDMKCCVDLTAQLEHTLLKRMEHTLLQRMEQRMDAVMARLEQRVDAAMAALEQRVDGGMTTILQSLAPRAPPRAPPTCTFLDDYLHVPLKYFSEDLAMQRSTLPPMSAKPSPVRLKPVTRMQTPVASDSAGTKKRRATLAKTRPHDQDQ